MNEPLSYADLPGALRDCRARCAELERELERAQFGTADAERERDTAQAQVAALREALIEIHPQTTQHRHGKLRPLTEICDAVLADTATAAAEYRQHVRADLVSLIEEAWYQWSIVPDGFDEQSLDAPRYDGCLSTLEAIQSALIDEGRIVRYDLAPGKEWYVRVTPPGVPK